MHKYFEINAQGHNIRCKLYHQGPGTAKRAVIFCTGFAGHKDNRAAETFADKLLSKHKDVILVVFNWPAHGDDVKKKLTLEDCGVYLDLVVRETKARFGAQQLYAYAASFGGYLVLKYISEQGSPFEKITLRCPAVDMYGVMTRDIMRNDEYERIMKGKDVQAGFDRKVTITRAFLDALKENDIRRRDFLDWAEDLLILHGTADEVVPFADGKAFAEDNLIEFIPVEGADHRFQNPLHMSLATKAVLQFFAL